MNTHQIPLSQNTEGIALNEGRTRRGGGMMMTNETRMKITVNNE